MSNSHMPIFQLLFFLLSIAQWYDLQEKAQIEHKTTADKEIPFGWRLLHKDPLYEFKKKISF